MAGVARAGRARERRGGGGGDDDERHRRRARGGAPLRGSIKGKTSSSRLVFTLPITHVLERPTSLYHTPTKPSLFAARSPLFLLVTPRFRFRVRDLKLRLNPPMNRPPRARARPPHQGTAPGGGNLTTTAPENTPNATILKRARRRRTRPAPPAAAALHFFFGNGNNAAENNNNNNNKHVVFVRHGTTEMNEYLHTQCNYYSPDFKDPLIFDTRLTPDGERKARQAAKRAQRLQPRPELIVASPLTRALQTAELAFGPLLDEGVPCLALPLARERLFLSSDVGRPGHELAAEFPRWRDSLLELEDEWWLHRRQNGGESESSSTLSGSESGGDSDGDDGAMATATRRRSKRRLKTPTPKPNPAVEEEGDDDFACRMDALGEWLASRPEECVAIVSHWGVILEATGEEFQNVEMRAFRTAQLRL